MAREEAIRIAGNVPACIHHLPTKSQTSPSLALYNDHAQRLRDRESECAAKHFAAIERWKRLRHADVRSRETENNHGSVKYAGVDSSDTNLVTDGL